MFRWGNWQKRIQKFDVFLWNTNAFKPKRNQSKVEKSLFKMNVKRSINEQYDAEAANQHHSNRPISRKCQWTFLIVFLVQGMACCLIPLLWLFILPIFILLTGSKNQFRNYESQIFTISLTNQIVFTKNNSKTWKTCSSWPKKSWKIGTVVSELVVRSGEQDESFSKFLLNILEYIWLLSAYDTIS